MLVKLEDDKLWSNVPAGITQYGLHIIGKFHHISAVLTSNSFLAIPLWARRIFAVCWKLSSWL